MLLVPFNTESSCGKSWSNFVLWFLNSSVSGVLGGMSESRTSSSSSGPAPNVRSSPEGWSSGVSISLGSASATAAAAVAAPSSPSSLAFSSPSPASSPSSLSPVSSFSPASSACSRRSLSSSSFLLASSAAFLSASSLAILSLSARSASWRARSSVRLASHFSWSSGKE